MSKFSIRLLLAILLAVPTIAVSGLGLLQVASYYSKYRDFQKARLVERLGSAGGALALALPTESFAAPEQWTERRQETDAAFERLFSAYREWRASGLDDAIITELLDTIATRKTQALSTFRDKMDRKDNPFDYGLRELQPASAAGLALVRQTGTVIDDVGLARSIDGLHALMQTNDAALMTKILGGAYLEHGKLDMPHMAMVVHAQDLASIYGPSLRNNIPAALLGQYDDFQVSAEGKLIADVGERLKAGIEAAPATPDVVAAWKTATDRQAAFMKRLIDAANENLSASSDRALQAIFSTMLAYAIFTGMVLFVVVLLGIYVARTIAKLIGNISGRMSELRDGDAERPVPHMHRADQLGEMARSLEAFRLTALDKARLETAALEQRQQDDRARLEIAERAEREANERLDHATSAIAAGLRLLSKGDLGCPITQSLAPQFEPLRSDFNNSLQRLSELLSTFGDAVQTVSSGSAEIASASNDLAIRTEKQAAALEETAAALEEITVNVGATTNSTNAAHESILQAHRRAKRAGEVVKDAIIAMDKIENSSRMIGQITSVIDDIAFQTNLLALNAGIEAARAGEAGKGFAVVAQEVRELAQRSALAAQEIGQLIGASAQAVGEGVVLVKDTGGDLHDISTLIADVETQMEAIARAAQEQTAGLAEVNTAINHMDHTTQQNAAMVEQMNAAGSVLRQECDVLQRSMSSFRFGVTGQLEVQQKGFVVRKIA